MKKRILSVMPIVFALLALPLVGAYTTSTHIPLEAIGGPPTELQVGETYSQTFNIDTTGVSYDTCHDEANYQLGVCDYIYKCYVVMPQSCTELTCAKDYFCAELIDPADIETLSVYYTADTQDAGKVYAVAAFVLKSHMTYSWSEQIWTDTTTLVESTRTNDAIQVLGAPAPQAPDVLGKLGEFIMSIFQGLQTWLCTNWGIWC